ncbi:DUF1217 domain-containing protein [Paracoccus sp. 11-3]|uniref:DUF1217 domain-containing protein n=1 Tax=Paracoccus amoyensis TaxID=2760093 RepID=A0A926GD82_9RHOB|nr:DUF1217 domain-containing protein [Paracoccus amoyensis]MBC9246182.1 DUF1217 domain-containing protein [Paracoccus amoyensis]
MNISVATGLGSISGWKTLQRIEARQLAVIANDPVVQRATTYFRDNISSGTSAADLVGDYRMLSVALGAFGLEQDIPNKAFIRKVLESDLSDDKSLVNRLSDKRYLRLAQAFHLGRASSDQTALGKQISEAYLQREYERRVGESDESLRLALNARRELQQFVGRESSNKTLWYEVLGNPPLRKVFEGAFGFGGAYGRLSVDRQLEEFTKAAERYLGSSAFTDITTEKGIDKLVTNYLARTQVATGSAQNRYSSALALLTG